MDVSLWVRFTATERRERGAAHRVLIEPRSTIHARHFASSIGRLSRALQMESYPYFGYCLRLQVALGCSGSGGCSMRIFAALALCALVGGCGLIARKELQEKQQAAIAEMQAGFAECKARFPEGSKQYVASSNATAPPLR